MTEVLVQGAKGVKRRRTLDPYMLKVQEVLRREPFDPNRSRRLSIEGVAVSIEPWVIACVETQAGLSDDDNNRAELLGQSLALWLKSALDVRSLRREMQGGAPNLYEVQAKLMLDSSLGATLLQELQKCVDGLVKQGELEDAKRLSKFRGQVSGLVRELKKVISDSNGPSEAEPEAMPADAQNQPQPASTALANAPTREEDPEPQAPVRRRRSAPEKPDSAEPFRPGSGYRTKILMVLNAIALVSLIGLRMPSHLDHPTPRALEAKDFEGASALLEVVARPPSLYASVDKQIWSAYNPEQQRLFVESMGNVLHAAGYWGLTLKTSDDRLVGQWFEKSGTRVLQAATMSPTKPARTPGQYSRFVP